MNGQKNMNYVSRSKNVFVIYECLTCNKCIVYYQDMQLALVLVCLDDGDDVFSVRLQSSSFLNAFYSKSMRIFSKKKTFYLLCCF